MKQISIHVPVQIDGAVFRRFALFDTFQRQKLWRRPALFALILTVSSALCYSRYPQEGSLLLGTILIVLGLGMPLVWYLSYEHSLHTQAKKMGLSTPKSVYRVELGPNGVGMWPAGQQDKAQPAASHDWESVYGAWRTAQAVYLYISATKAYLLPAEEIPGGADAAWTLLGEHLPAEKLHVTR